MQACLLIVTLFYSITLWAEALDIATRYAPVVNQGLGHHPIADEFTRVDFDDDWNPDNNWDNLEKFKRPRVVYWDVKESEHNYFITYAFFYPRDYARWCFWIHCHENDFEGMRITVEKPSRIIKLEALAHNFKNEIINPATIEITIEKEGHGIYPFDLRKPEEPYKRYTPNDYELRPLAELWAKKESSLFTGQFKYKEQSYPANFGGQKWILFGLGAAKPPWSWEIWGSNMVKGQWYLDPLKD